MRSTGRTRGCSCLYLVGAGSGTAMFLDTGGGPAHVAYYEAIPRSRVEWPRRVAQQHAIWGSPAAAA